MEALVTSFVAAFLATWGARTQLIVATLAAATRRPALVLAGLILAALASSIVAAIAGIWIAATITIRAMTLMTALALLFGGVSALIPRKRKEAVPARWTLPAAFILCLAAEMGDSAQFLTFALAGRFASAPLAAAGATAGIVAACLPAAILGDRLQEVIPIRAIRYAVAALFLVAGFIVAMKALQLA
ncbi:MAG TPA: TMEM165/GDT1 family protein [Allosphingosinicella sp.]|nr:TMEM165/GDT1 family protein [Allosphingosinicella sp.]